MAQDRRYGMGERGPLLPEPSWEQVLERSAIERLKLEKAPVAIVDEDLRDRLLAGESEGRTASRVEVAS